MLYILFILFIIWMIWKIKKLGELVKMDIGTAIVIIAFLIYLYKMFGKD